MEQIGKVVDIYDKKAKVQIQRISACGGDCGKCSGCTPTAMIVIAENEIQANVGQIVILDASTRNILAVAFMMYIVPIILFIVGYVAAYSYTISSNLLIDAQNTAFFVGACLLIVSFLILRFSDKRLQQSNKLDLKITRIMR